MNIRKQSKWENYGLWVSLFSLVGILFREYLPENYQEITTIILTILVGLGIVSNPSKGKGYSDK